MITVNVHCDHCTIVYRISMDRAASTPAHHHRLARGELPCVGCGGTAAIPAKGNPDLAVILKSPPTGSSH